MELLDEDEDLEEDEYPDEDEDLVENDGLEKDDAELRFRRGRGKGKLR